MQKPPSQKITNENEFWLKEAQRIGHMGSYLLDIASGAWTSSEVLDEIFGIDAQFRHDVAGWADIIHPDHRQMMVEYFQNDVLKQHKTFDKEYMIVRQNDRMTRWVHGYGELVFDGSQEPLKMIGTIQDITQQKATEEKLAKINRYNSLILDSAAEGILGLDSAGNHIFINPAANKILGYAPDELIGRFSHDTWHHTKADGNPYPHEKCEIYAAFRDGQLHRSASEIFWRKDGSSFPVEWASTPIIENGQAIGTVVTFTDISERIESENKLRNSEDYLRAIVSNEPECVKVIDRDGNLLDMNPAGLRMIGAENLEQVKGKSIYPLIVPGYKEQFKNNIERVFAGETIIDEFDMLSLQGTIHHMRTHAVPLRNEKSEIFAYLAITLDITEKKNLDLAIKESLRRLNDSQHIAQVGSWELDIPTNKLIWSDEIFKIFEIDPSRFSATYETFLDAIHPDDRDMVNNAYAKSLENKQPYDIEHRLQMPDGRIKFVREKCSTTYDKDGKPLRSLGTIQDITLSHEAETRIKDLSELRNKFITIISHQLRTPLTSVNWNLEMLLNGSFGKMEETQHKFLHATHEASLEITRRIHDLLTAMDIEEGRDFFEKEDISFDGLCSGMVNEMRKKAALRNTVIECATEHPDLPMIEGDGEKIRTVIRKLVENAIFYTPEGGRISVKITPTDLGICFEVNDNGIGIPKSEQHHIFERFFRGSNASVMLTDAFGLGLFISKHIISQHGGRIGFESEENKGSRFWFEIPTKK